MNQINQSSLMNAMFIIGGEIIIGDGYIDIKGNRLESIPQPCITFLEQLGFGYVPWLFSWRYPKDKIPSSIGYDYKNQEELRTIKEITG